MNEIRASFKVTDKENLGKLIIEFSSRTLFGDNKKLTVEDGQVTLYALFDETPEALINYIVKCEDLKIECNIVNEEPTDNNEKTEEIKNVNTKKIKKETKIKATFDKELPEKIKEIIRSNSDKNEVAIKICDWVEASVYTEVFTALISNKLNDFNVSIKDTYQDMEKITDKAQLSSKCVAFSAGIKKKLKKIGYNGTAIEFLNDVFQYYHKIWSNNKKRETSSQEEDSKNDDDSENNDDDEKDKDDTIKVPEVKEKPKNFKSFLNLSPKKIVEQKLQAMPENISKKEKIQYIFNKVLNANISEDVVENILKALKSDITVLTVKERMVIATAIYTYCPGVKSEEFLKNLKEFIN